MFFKKKNMNKFRFIAEEKLFFEKDTRSRQPFPLLHFKIFFLKYKYGKALPWKNILFAAVAIIYFSSTVLAVVFKSVTLAIISAGIGVVMGISFVIHVQKKNRS